MPDLKCDVLIAGAGPTGLVLSNLLGGMGINVMLVERNASTVDEPRAVSIDDESMRTMQALDLIEEIEGSVAQGYGSRYISPSGKQFATVDPTSKDYGFDKRNAFQQPDLESRLRVGLERYPSIKTFFAHELSGFEQDDTGVVATVASSSHEFTVRARYMVACDGGRSSIRKQLGINLVGSTYRERWLIVDLKQTFNRFRHTQVYCDPARSCITLPGPDGIRRYEFMLRSDEEESAVIEEAFVRELLGKIGPDRDAEIRRRRVYTFHARLAERWRIGRTFLAGDAAHLTPPFAGQGMNSGVRDAQNLAWKLAHVLRNGENNSMLDSYERERRPHVWEMIKLSSSMGYIMTPKSALHGALTRAGFRLLDLLPAARDYVVQMRYKPKPRFRDGLLWADGLSERKTLVGRLLPQPIVEDVDRNRTLLDNVLGRQSALVVFSETPETAVDGETISFLRHLGIAVIGITPEWMNPIRSELPTYRDVSRLMSSKAFVPYREHYILVRPDRYVAATAPIDNLVDLEAAVQMLATASFPVSCSPSDEGVQNEAALYKASGAILEVFRNQNRKVSSRRRPAHDRP